MISVTNHCLDRYAERILGIEDSQTARQYINSNREKVIEDINKMFQYATLVCTAQINGDKSTKNYWLRDNIILVTDTADSSIITLYRIDFGLGDNIDRLVTEKLMEELAELSEKRIQAINKVADEVDIKTTEVLNIEAEIKRQMQYVSNLQLRKETLQNEIKIANQEVELVSKDIEVRALKICNSAEYRKDLLKLNIGK